MGPVGPAIGSEPKWVRVQFHPLLGLGPVVSIFHIFAHSARNIQRTVSAKIRVSFFCLSLSVNIPFSSTTIKLCCGHKTINLSDLRKKRIFANLITSPPNIVWTTVPTVTAAFVYATVAL
jgi:hypothetical protein